MNWRERWHRMVDVAIELRIARAVSSMHQGYRVAARMFWSQPS